MDYRRASELEEMIQNQIFYGIPISEISSDMLDDMDNEDLRTFYIIVNMLHWEAIDDLTKEVDFIS
jgi:hypothetical protein